VNHSSDVPTGRQARFLLFPNLNDPPEFMTLQFTWEAQREVPLVLPNRINCVVSGATFMKMKGAARPVELRLLEHAREVVFFNLNAYGRKC